MVHPSLGRAAILAAGLFALVACSEPVDVSPLLPDEPGGVPGSGAAMVTCVATVKSGSIECGERPVPWGGVRPLIIGNQGVYVQLTSSNVTVQADTFAFDVTVQNLIPQPLGTTDGTTPHENVVRVFFSQGPTATLGSGVVRVENADGTGIFTVSSQPYFQYDEILAQNQVSAPRRWKLGLDPDVETFSFRLYVSTEVPHPTGWVDIAPVATPFISVGGTRTLTAELKSVVGVQEDSALVWASSDTTVATVDGAGIVTGVAPGRVSISATRGARGGAVSIDVCPALAVGEVYTAEMPGAASLCFAGGSADNAEYTYFPINLSGAASLSLTTTGTGIVPVTGPPTTTRIPANGALLLASAAQAAADAGHLRFREADARLLAPRLGRASSRDLRPTAPRRLVVPSLGDPLTFNVALGCSGARDERTGLVRSVGTSVVIVADTSNPAGGFTTAQYDSIRLEYDSLSAPVVQANFGAPTDRDDNGRVILFFTRAVNELSPPASSAITPGYFTNRDLFDSDPASCTRSNVGEIIYMMVPDPTGAVNSNVRQVSFVRGNTIRTTAHELQHLVNAGARYAAGFPAGFEEGWLDEGLSRITEELIFYRTSVGLAPRSNIVVTNLTTGPSASRRVAAFNTYANQNFGMLRSWLQRPDTNGVFKSGASQTLANQGVSWAFLRYAADRTGGSEPAFWASLVNPSLVGKANLQAAIGADPDAWLRDFIAAIYADDSGVATDPRYQALSWNYRSLFTALYTNLNSVYGMRPLTNATGLTLSYSRGGGTAFARFGVPSGGYATVTALSGGVAPTSPFSLAVLRTK